MRYSVTFDFCCKPPFEVILPTETIDTMPGQVVLSFLQVDHRDAGSIRAFLEGFKAGWFYVDGKRIDAAAAGALLPLEQAEMRQFIETVLLVPAPEWYLTDVPPSSRVPVFFHRFPQKERLERHFQGVSLRPVVHLRPEKVGKVFTRSGPTKAAEEWGEAWEKRKKQPGELLKMLPEWETLTWRYETESLLAVCWLELFLMAEHNLAIRKCENCEGYFVRWPANTVYCRKCRGNNSRQRLYWQKKAEGMGEEEREALKKYHREHKQVVRRIKDLYAAGKTIAEIAEETGCPVDWVEERVSHKKRLPPAGA